jgi:hypothetical protein
MVTMADPRDATIPQRNDVDRLYLTCTLVGTRYLIPTGMVREVEEVGAIPRRSPRPSPGCAG